MTVEIYIIRIRQANPKLFSGKMLTLSPESLEKQLRLAYEAGREAGKKEAPDYPPGFNAFFGKMNSFP